MEVRSNSYLLTSLLSLGVNNNGNQGVSDGQNIPPPPPKKSNAIKDSVSISEDSNQEQSKNNQNNAFTANPDRTFLVSERVENLENGFRKLQEFESLTGKKFTKIEEVINSDNRSTRTIVQQNDSGSTTLLENIFDRQNDGSFRLTQRYTDEVGETKSNIQYDAQPNDTNFIVGNNPRPESSTDTPFQIQRGTQYDVSA